jgi:predicted permease
MTVIGVSPAGFRGVDPTEAPELWIPASMKFIATPEWDHLLNRRAFWMHVFGRLKPGVTAEAAQAGLAPWFAATLDAETRVESFPAVTAEQRKSFLASSLVLDYASRGISEQRPALRRPLWLLMSGTGLLLLLACLNVAGLLLARGAARNRELTTRVALGASRGRIAEQVLVESGLIAVGGGLLGLAVAPAVFQVLRSFLAGGADLAFHLDARLFLFTLGACLVTAVLCGLAPAIQSGRIQLITDLKERSALGASRGVRMRKALLVGQMAFTLILLTGAGLFMQTVSRLRAKGPGFDAASLLMFRVDPPAIGYPEADADRAMRTLLRGLQEAPGVDAAAVANTHILTAGGSSSVFTVQHEERIVTDRVTYTRVGQGFFSVLGAELVAGRDFSEADMRAPGAPEVRPRVVIVNESFARKYLGGRNPIGYRIGQGNRPTTVTDVEIIGVVRDFNRRTLREEGLEQLFFCFWDRQSADGTFYVRMRGGPESGFAAIRQAVAKLDRSLPVTGLTTFEGQMDRSLGNERMLATLSSGFGAIALLLSVVGLYGVMSFVVTRRTQEIGVRLALGATPGSAVWLVVRDALVMLAVGTGIALLGAWGLGRMVEAQLYGVRAFDVPTVAVAAALLAMVALGASLLPAWRAATVSPTEALRSD